jgi:AraC-like DNA-binding protein
MTSTHPFYTWWWLDQGSVTLILKDKKCIVPARHWVLIPVGMTRHQHFSDDAVLNSINFAARWPNGLPLLRLPDLVIQKATARHPLITFALATQRAAGTPVSSRFVSLDQRHLSLGGCVRLFAALGHFIACLLDQPALREMARCAPATGDSRLDLVLDQMSRRLRAGPLPYAAWKQATGLSRPQLDRLARSSLGFSLRHHRDHLLLAEVYRRLSIDHSAIKLHAMELGFVDSAHFCRWVKHQSGLTPKLLASCHT